MDQSNLDVLDNVASVLAIVGELSSSSEDDFSCESERLRMRKDQWKIDKESVWYLESMGEEI